MASKSDALTRAYNAIADRRQRPARKNYITRGELVELMRRDKGGMGLRAYAKQLGVSGSLIGGILRGEREPGPKVAAYFGFPEAGYLRRRA